MSFVIVPKDFPRVPVKILDYPAESDPGPFPIPDDAPIENWPLHKNENTARPAPARADPGASSSARPRATAT